MSVKSRRLLATVSAVALALFGGMLILAMVIYFNDRQAEPATTSIAVPRPSTPREVKDITTSSDGNLIITYTDGSIQNAGRVVGSNGRDGVGQVPSQAQLSAALIEYCANGKCDAKEPTQEQIFSAITAYCLGGVCKGSDASPVTTEQIVNAVNSYCSDGRCKGSTGDTGPKGAQGESTVMACVKRDDADYVAWKYVTEPDSLFRNLYRLPLPTECSEPIDLKGA